MSFILCDGECSVLSAGYECTAGISEMTSRPGGARPSGTRSSSTSAIIKSAVLFRRNHPQTKYATIKTWQPVTPRASWQPASSCSAARSAGC